LLERRDADRETSRNDLKSVLAKSASTLNVGLLLESIALCAEFEREMAKKYSLSVRSPVSYLPFSH
jgi:hypothetical protein